MTEAFSLVMTTQSISRHCQMPLGEKIPTPNPGENHSDDPIWARVYGLE